MSKNITVGIMACRERAVHIYEMMYKLKEQGYKPVVMWDDERKGSWNNALLFWSSLETEFGLLLQDDVTFHETFMANIKKITEQVEIESFVSGFYATAFTGEIIPPETRWMTGVYGLWGQCLLSTKKFVDGMLKDVWKYVKYFDGDSPKKIAEAKALGVTRKQGDDVVYGAYMECVGKSKLVTNPSLVQHLEFKSLDGNPVRPFGKTRQALEVADRVYDWKMTEDNTKQGQIYYMADCIFTELGLKERLNARISSRK